jgi:hypothetical protein
VARALTTVLRVTGAKVVRAAHSVGVLRLDSTFEMVSFVHLLRRNNGFHHVGFCIRLRDAQTQHERTHPEFASLEQKMQRYRALPRGSVDQEKNRLDTEIRQLAKSIKVACCS